MNNADIAALRREYSMQALSEHNVQENPVGQFMSWFDEAVGAHANEPSAMTLATASLDGHPSARVVLLKGVSEEGFAFFTNYASDKGQEILRNPNVSLVFFWPELERQVRINGTATQLSAEMSDEYFASRPYDSQVGAWTSQQSSVISSRTELEERFNALVEQFAGEPIPRPETWGGFVVSPEQFEFWQGRPNRLHDRIRYRKENSSWIIERLSP